jgi:hypothetical protein
VLTSRCAQEYYADYWALDSALVSLELENNVACFMPQTWESQVRRIARTLAARALSGGKVHRVDRFHARRADDAADV